ncbi:hypothetical protein GVAV_001373 [Gurleya vavrai]
MIFYLLLLKAFDSEKHYRIITIAEPFKNLALEKKTIRFMMPTVILSKEDEAYDKVKLIPKENNFYIVFEDGKYMCRDGAKGMGVIACEASGWYKAWKLVKIENNVYNIQQGPDCLTLYKFDEKFNGNFVHAKKCENSDEQKFKIEEVIKESLEKRNENIEEQNKNDKNDNSEKKIVEEHKKNEDDKNDNFENEIVKEDKKIDTEVYKNSVSNAKKRFSDTEIIEIDNEKINLDNNILHVDSKRPDGQLQHCVLNEQKHLKAK